MNKEIQDKIDAQAKLQKEKGYPAFAPKTGVCYNCHHQIYEEIIMEKASTQLITGCPVCKHSYCD